MSVIGDKINDREITYGTHDISNLIYSSALSLKSEVDKINIKTIERKNNNELKLLLSEILFINRYIENDNSLIVYIGAAPGTHINKLIKLYPNMRFHLYDPLEIEVEESNNVIKFNKNFTLDDCKLYKEMNDVYIITDFKDVKYNRDPSFHTFHEKNEWQMEKEKSYYDDMILQRDICLSIIPKAAYLRFRPKHFYNGITNPDEVFEYFNGIIWLMIYNEYKSTETRLAVTDFTNINFKWSLKAYQYKMNYFNCKIRESLSLNPFTNDSKPLPNQLGNKFETIMMIKIILEYFITIGIYKPRIGEIMNFYSEFLVAEQCGDNDYCDLEEVN